MEEGPAVPKREEARKSRSPRRKSQKLPGLGRKKKTVTWAPAPGEFVHQEHLVHRMLGLGWERRSREVVLGLPNPWEMPEGAGLPDAVCCGVVAFGGSVW